MDVIDDALAKGDKTKGLQNKSFAAVLPCLAFKNSTKGERPGCLWAGYTHQLFVSYIYVLN